MRNKLKEVLKSEKGNGILAFIVVISVTAIIGISIIPSFRQVLGNRMSKTIEYYNGTDTITKVD